MRLKEVGLKEFDDVLAIQVPLLGSQSTQNNGSRGVRESMQRWATV